MTVLCWIKNNKPWKQYVMNRVQEIREDTFPESRNFCPGVQNPAYIPSWGMTASELVTESKWCKDHEFLCNFETEWPREENAHLETEGALKEIYVLRLTRRSRIRKSLDLKVEEIQFAEELWIKSIQSQSLSAEVCHLIHRSLKNSPVPVLVQQFGTHLEYKGIVRCRRRIQKCSLNQEGKTPVLPPWKHEAVDLSE